MSWGRLHPSLALDVDVHGNWLSDSSNQTLIYNHA